MTLLRGPDQGTRKMEAISEGTMLPLTIWQKLNRASKIIQANEQLTSQQFLECFEVQTLNEKL